MKRLFGALAELAAGMIVGAAFGYVAGVLLAPAEGRDTRAELASRAAAIGDVPADLRRTLEARLQHAVSEAQRAAADARQALEAMAGWGGQADQEPPATGAI